MFLVYLVTSPSNKYYVGITSTSFNERKRKHNNRANLQYKNKFCSAIRKYKENLIWEIIDTTAKTWEELCKLEIFYIKKYNSFEKGYNSTLGGDGMLGLKHSDKTKKVLSDTFSGENNPFYGKKHSIETRQKMVKSHEGRVYTKGKLRNEETKLKMSLTKGGKLFKVYKKDTKEFVGEWISKSQCARDLNLSSSGNLATCLNNKNRSCKGYTFEYSEDK